MLRVANLRNLGTLGGVLCGRGKGERRDRAYYERVSQTVPLIGAPALLRAAA